jgi:hypothetical protein
MASPGMLSRVALVRTDVSEELSTYIIGVTRIGELGTLDVTSNRRTLRRNTSVLTRATRRNIPEDVILHSHRRENLKSYIKAHVIIPRVVCVNLQSCLLQGLRMLGNLPPLFVKYIFETKVYQNEMGGACSTLLTCEECVQYLYRKT